MSEGDEPVEDELVESFGSTVEEGAERLRRTWRVTLITGFFGGVEVGLGILVYLTVLDQTGDHLLAGLTFSVGLIALLMAHSELFTENFLVPVAAAVARESSIGQLG